MTEQEEGKELSTQFPMAPGELVKRLQAIFSFFVDVSSDPQLVRQNESITGLMEREEPVLSGEMDKLVQRLYDRNDLADPLAPPEDIPVSRLEEDRQEFIRGLQFMYAVLHELGLPKVGVDTIATFIGEWERQCKMFINPVRGTLSTDPEIRKVAYQEIVWRLGSDDFSFPTPLNYAYENPPLMVLVASSTYPRHLGAMIMYELKRRQWHADQLEKQFGG